MQHGLIVVLIPGNDVAQKKDEIGLQGLKIGNQHVIVFSIFPVVNIGDDRDPDIAADFFGGLPIEACSIVRLCIPSVKGNSCAEDNRQYEQRDQKSKEYPPDCVFFLPRFLRFRCGFVCHSFLKPGFLSQFCLLKNPCCLIPGAGPGSIKGQRFGSDEVFLL